MGIGRRIDNGRLPWRSDVYYSEEKTFKCELHFCTILMDGRESRKRFVKDIALEK